jgi:hypothetical protein
MVRQWRRRRDHQRRRSAGAVAPQATETVPIVPPTEAGRTSSSEGGPLSDPEFVAGLRPIPSGALGTPSPWPASDIVGVSPAGTPVEARVGQFGGLVLLAFLTTRCDGCEEFWRGLGDGDRTDLPGSVSTVVVTKGPATTAPAAVEQVAAGITRVPVIMSDEAWTDYRVTGYPFFVLVDAPTRTVVGETVGFGWPDVISMIRTAAG